MPEPRDDLFSSHFRLVASIESLQAELSWALYAYMKVAFPNTIKGSHYMILDHVSPT